MQMLADIFVNLKYSLSILLNTPPFFFLAQSSISLYLKGIKMYTAWFSIHDISSCNEPHVPAPSSAGALSCLSTGTCILVPTH